MVGCSLLHRGDGVPGAAGRAARYVAERSTMGIPLLHPWANRLGAWRFEVVGREVDLDAADPPAGTDPNGLPIHGLLSAAPGWEVTGRDAADDGGTIAARFDFAAHEGLLRAVSVPARDRDGGDARRAARSTIATTVVEATGDAPVPISFGLPPVLPAAGGGPRRLGGRDPGARAPAPRRPDAPHRASGRRSTVEPGPLGARTFDDAYVAPPDPRALRPSRAAGRRIEVAFGSGFPFAQVYAPADDDVIALEPMTAPTNALVTGAPDCPSPSPASATARPSR